MSDRWTRLTQKAEDLYEQIRLDLSSGDVSEADVKQRMTKLRKRMEDMAKYLREVEADTDHIFSDNQKRHMQNSMNDLRHRVEQLEQQSKTADRKALFKGYGAASGHKETETDVSGMRNKQIYEQQKKTMEAQDHTLDSFEGAVTALGHTARTIGDEASYQTKLLDDTEVDVEEADRSLAAETRHAEHVKEYSTVCWMYIIILLEIVAVCILLVMNFS